MSVQSNLGFQTTVARQHKMCPVSVTAALADDSRSASRMEVQASTIVVGNELQMARSTANAAYSSCTCVEFARWMLSVRSKAFPLVGGLSYPLSQVPLVEGIFHRRCGSVNERGSRMVNHFPGMARQDRPREYAKLSVPQDRVEQGVLRTEVIGQS